MCPPCYSLKITRVAGRIQGIPNHGQTHTERTSGTTLEETTDSCQCNSVSLHDFVWCLQDYYCTGWLTWPFWSANRRLTIVLASWDLLLVGWYLHGCHLGSVWGTQSQKTHILFERIFVITGVSRRDALHWCCSVHHNESNIGKELFGKEKKKSSRDLLFRRIFFFCPLFSFVLHLN